MRWCMLLQFGQYQPSFLLGLPSSLVSLMFVASLHHCRPQGRPLRSLLRSENRGGVKIWKEGWMDEWMEGVRGWGSPQGLQRQHLYQSLDGRRGWFWQIISPSAVPPPPSYSPSLPLTLHGWTSLLSRFCLSIQSIFLSSIAAVMHWTPPFLLLLLRQTFPPPSSSYPRVLFLYFSSPSFSLPHFSFLLSAVLYLAVKLLIWLIIFGILLWPYFHS